MKRDIKYTGEFERQICAPYWKPYFDDNTKIESAMKKLTANMNEEQINKVEVIIERISRILNEQEVVLS